GRRAREPRPPMDRYAISRRAGDGSVAPAITDGGLRVLMDECRRPCAAILEPAARLRQHPSDQRAGRVVDRGLRSDPRGRAHCRLVGMTTAAQREAVASRLLACGAAAGPLFTLAWLVEGATRAGYDPLRHPVSSLAIGEVGWTQRASFVLTGLLTI